MNYNREFLVPYLENVCALHLAERELDEMIEELNVKLKRIERGSLDETVHYKKSDINLFWAILLSGISFVIAFFIARFYYNLIIEEGIGPVLGMTVIILGGLLLYGPTQGLTATLLGAFAAGLILVPVTISQNKELDKQNKAETIRAQNAKETNERVRKEQLPVIETYIAQYSTDRDNVRSLMKEAYNVNIIPSRYRDIYTAVYLYDYFSTSMSTDLEAALNLYVLEQIKDRLDRIIKNQAEIILNQRVMIAKQQESIVLQKEHNENIISKIDKMISGDEERNMYLRMIEVNTSATTYFAAADYFASRKDTII